MFLLWVYMLGRKILVVVDFMIMFKMFEFVVLERFCVVMSIK